MHVIIGRSSLLLCCPSISTYTKGGATFYLISLWVLSFYLAAIVFGAGLVYSFV